MAKVSINLATGSLQQEDIIVGIDLGTTNSLVAFTTPDGETRVINDAGKGVLVPSVVHFAPSGDIIVGNQAKDFLVTDPANTIFSVKRLLGRSYNDVADDTGYLGYRIIDDADNTESLVKVAVGDKYYTPVELSALILRELKLRAEHSLKTPVNRAVITVPAYFNDSQRQATRDAGKLAGLNVLRIVNEPTAAALAYGINRQSSGQVICVYDLGGGTFDCSVLSLDDGIFDVLSTHGDTRLGGDDFDRAIVNHWLSVNANQFSGHTNSAGFMQLIRTQAEEAKKALSSQNVYTAQAGGFDFAITRQTFEELIQPLITRTIQACTQALAAAGVTPAQVHDVIMVGGSTRVPAVYNAVQQLFNKAPHTNINPDEVVAIGAAIQADILAGNRSDVLLLDVTPLSLGIETMGGLMDVIIERNTKVPYKAGRQYTTSVDGQVNLKVAVYQGERDMVSQNRKLAEFVLQNIPAMPAGLPKIDINFILDADGILKVEARELRSGTVQSIDVKPTYGLSDEQVEQMLIDSITHAKGDVEARMLAEAVQDARQLVYTAGRFVEKNASMLSADEVAETRKLMDAATAAIDTNDKNAVIAATEALNNYTRPFAERLMDVAVAQAMKGKSIGE